MKKILIVDDDAEFRGSLSEVLRGVGYQADEAASGPEAIKKAASPDIDIVLLDLMMPGMSGLETLMEIRRVNSKVRVVMVTAFATIGNAVEAIKRGASDYISKPFKVEVLLTMLKRVLEEARFEEGVKQLDLDTTVGSLSNSIRRSIIRLLQKRGTMRLMELTRELDIEDHTKVVFHLKMLKEAGVVEQNEKKAYAITMEGKKTVECLGILEKYLSSG